MPQVHVPFVSCQNSDSFASFIDKIINESEREMIAVLLQFLTHILYKILYKIYWYHIFVGPKWPGCLKWAWRDSNFCHKQIMRAGYVIWICISVFYEWKLSKFQLPDNRLIILKHNRKYSRLYTSSSDDIKVILKNQFHFEYTKCVLKYYFVIFGSKSP